MSLDNISNTNPGYRLGGFSQYWRKFKSSQQAVKCEYQNQQFEIGSMAVHIKYPCCSVRSFDEVEESPFSKALKTIRVTMRN